MSEPYDEISEAIEEIDKRSKHHLNMANIKRKQSQKNVVFAAHSRGLSEGLEQALKIILKSFTKGNK